MATKNTKQAKTSKKPACLVDVPEDRRPVPADEYEEKSVLAALKRVASKKLAQTR